MSTNQPPPRGGIAFLLSQLGAHAAGQFAHALEAHNLTPPLAGVMRLLRTAPEMNQKQLAQRLGVAPSRIVSYLDDLENRGWIVRTRGTGDRRVNDVALTSQGLAAFGILATVAREHEETTTAALDDAERADLFKLLTKLTEHSTLTPSVHPGYQTKT